MVFLFDFVFFIHPHTAPLLPPSNVKVTLIEEDTALVSWKSPDEPNVAVTHYTILYASRNAWIAGEWQVLQREGKEESGKRSIEKEVIHVCRGGDAQNLSPVQDKMVHWKPVIHFIIQSMSLFIVISEWCQDRSDSLLLSYR